MIILLLMLLVEVSCVGSFNALEGSYKEATVYTGIVSAALRASLETFMEVRLRPSSISTINTAWNKHWIPFCNEYDLPEFVVDGDPNRAGVMASFVLTLAYVDDKQLPPLPMAIVFISLIVYFNNSFLHVYCYYLKSTYQITDAGERFIEK